MQAGVAAEKFAGSRDDVAGFFWQFTSLLVQIAFDELHVVSRGDKTNFLAFGLFGDRYMQAAGDFADFVLRKFAEREIGAGKLFLRQAEEEIRLVLGLVHGAEELVAAGLRVVADARVVASGDAFSADLAGGDQELIELHVIVAHGARDGRTAFEVVRDEGLDYIELEFAFEVNDVKRDA